MLTTSRPLFRNLLALLFVFAMIAAACGDDDDSGTAASDDSAASTSDGSSESSDSGDSDDGTGEDFSDFKVVMILDGSAEDGGWNTTHLLSLIHI